jgi:hypothetical protein
MANEFARKIQDANLTTTKALPAAAANNSHDGIDLGLSYHSPGNVELEISWPAITALVDDKTIIFTVNDSADNSSFTSLGLTHTLTGAGGVGVAAGTKRFRLPSNTRRYINVNQAVLTAGGTLTASSTTVKLLF